MLSATPSKYILYQGNTQSIQITGLYDEVSSTYLNSATLVATLVDDNGNLADAELDEISFTYVPGSNGNYIATFGDNNFLPLLGTGYTLIIDGNQSGSYIHLELLVEIRARQS